MIVVANVETGEISERNATDEELQQYAKDAAEREIALNIKLAEQSEAAAAKAALLEKLGITEEEARLLLGGN